SRQSSRFMPHTMSSKDNTISFPELIKLKRDCGQLNRAEISTFVQGVTSGAIQKSQIGAMLMAIWQKGMTDEETLAMTREMMNSGETFKWPKEWLVVDKHSTGGVGDKVSLPLAPALAACGCKVPMISGRGLAHTGGTLDKLESIPGFKVNQSVEQVMWDLFKLQMICMKYAHFLCFLNSARRLAQSLVMAGNKLGVKTGAVLSRMDAPIGQSVGNAVEVCEALECLKGRGSDDLKELVICLGGYLLWMCGHSGTLDSGKTEIAVKLENGEALKKFEAMLVAQGVSADVAHSLCSNETDYSKHMKRAAHQTELEVLDDGAVLDIDGLALAEVLHKLGAGRTKSGEEIDHSVGAEILVEMGQQVKKGQPWIRIHHNCPNLKPHYSDLRKALVIGSHDKYETASRVAEFIHPDYPNMS
uniref:Thymidine phosphorylase n=2 Tax=Cyprinus carpio TaxID=7962 RepID=A0A8C2PRG3_CYPCA